MSQNLPILIFFHLFQMMEAQLNARIQHLKFGNQTIWNLNMVTYVKNGLGLGTDVIKHGLGAIVKIVENFAKRHVTNAQVGSKSKFIHNLIY